MSKGNSIFSNPSSSNGNAPANPFASLNPRAASPFSAAAEDEEKAKATDSPFGFADEATAAPERGHLPEKRAPESKIPAAPEGNPFSSSPAMAQPASAESEMQSPFSPSVGFEAPSEPEPKAEAPAPAAEPYQPAPEPHREAAPVFQEPQHQEPQHQAASVAPVAAATAAPFASAAPAAASGRGQSTRQLELRAIFGVEGEMGREQILHHAKGLPGIHELSVVGASEMNAIATLGEVMSRFGYGDSSSWQMSCSGGVVDFISAENTTLAILREGRYPAGVWEKLMIVARELDRLS